MKKNIFKNLASFLLVAMTITSCYTGNNKTTETSSNESSAITSENIVETVQSQDVDKSKCNEDHIFYNRLLVAYQNLFSEIEYGYPEFASSSSSDFLSEELQKILDTPNITYPQFNITTGESTNGCENQYKFSGGDWSVNIIRLYDHEKLYQAALQKHPISVPFDYEVRTFYNDQRFDSDSKIGNVQVIMIYENNDWFIDDIIYANKQTLRNTLKNILAKAEGTLTSELDNSCNNVIGTWEGNCDFGGIPMYETLVFKKDGSGMHKVNDVRLPFTWKMKDTSTIEAQSSEGEMMFKIINGHITDIRANGSYGTTFYRK